MTCGHCVASVTEEVSEVGGVEDVAVELESGTVTVTSAAPSTGSVRRRGRGGRLRAGLTQRRAGAGRRAQRGHDEG